MIAASLKCCQNCNSLKELLHQIDKKLYQDINHLFYNDIYNTDNVFNAYQYKRLLRYKRVALNRIYNSKYAESIDIQDIITQITLILHK